MMEREEERSIGTAKRGAKRVQYVKLFTTTKLEMMKYYSSWRSYRSDQDDTDGVDGLKEKSMGERMFQRAM